jgi:cytochrome c556
MKQIIVFLIAAFFAVTGAALAQDNPIKQRQDLMKGNGDAMKLVGEMLKGEKPYEADAAAKALTKISGSMDEFPTLFPESSKPTPDVKTDAKPNIWEDMADFKAKAEEVKTASAKAAEAAAGGLDSLKGAIGAVGKGCKGCHEEYRVKKN